MSVRTYPAPVISLDVRLETGDRLELFVAGDEGGRDRLLLPVSADGNSIETIEDE